ncbi:MAG TPA: type VII secretion integral membrane protein EccD [Nakamurella sp.]|nr:type VII secretion integral membrane protein EccD [Nakamurella sp.]
MGTRFTRVTVVGGARQVDVSLPADEPLSAQLPTLLRLLSVPSAPSPVRWALSTPEIGVIARDRSLDDAGVLDGTVLHLTPLAQAARPPFVDDVEGAAAEAVTELAPAWAGPARRSGIGVLLAVLLAVAVLRCGFAGSPVGWAGAAVTAILALLVGAMIREPGGAAAALVCAPALAVVALQVGGPAEGEYYGVAVPLATLGAGAGALAAGLVRRWPGMRVAGVTAVVLGGVATIGARLGLQPDRVAGLVLLLAVIGVGLAGQFALGGAGLVNLMRLDEDGERVPRQTVQQAVRRGQSAATGLVWCCALLAGAAVAVLAVAPGSGAPDWINRVLAAVGGLIFAVRSRMFTRARQVLPMLLTAVLAAAAIALAASGWLGLTGRPAPLLSLALLALLVAVLVASGLAELPEVPRARMRRMLDLLDALAVLALVPLLVLLFAAIPAVQRWLG